MDQPNQQPQLQVKADDKVLAGTYSNLMQVNFTKEEFILDFMSVFPPAGTLNARVIMSPAHAKRMAAVLADVVKKYETANGAVEAAQQQQGEIGFAAK